jgi:hypothetical protein
LLVSRHVRKVPQPEVGASPQLAISKIAPCTIRPTPFATPRHGGTWQPLRKAVKGNKVKLSPNKTGAIVRGLRKRPHHPAGGNGSLQKKCSSPPAASVCRFLQQNRPNAD